MLWRMLVISAVLIVVVSGAVAEVAGGYADFQLRKQTIALALGVLGVLLLIFGKRRAMQRAGAEFAQKPAAETDTVTAPGNFIGSLQYWGPMLMLFAVVVFLATPANLKVMSFLKLSDFKLSSLKSLVPEKKAPENIGPEKEVPAPVIEFPPMKMQGVTASSRRPSVIINAKTYFIGERVGNAVVTFIDRQSVTLELGGQTKVLSMRN